MANSVQEMRDLITPRIGSNEASTHRCEYCDGTGDVHSPDGEWRGVCHCPAGDALRGTEKEE